MKRLTFSAGFTLTEMVVSMAIILLFFGMLGWLGKGLTTQRITTERRLELLTKLQRVMGFMENDLFSARRHTLGNLLCNNVIFNLNPAPGTLFRTSSDPGFDLFYTRLSSSTADRNSWFAPVVPMVPMGRPNPGSVQAYIDRTPQNRLFGTGSLAIATSFQGIYAVRSPDFGELRDDTAYVLAGWVRGDSEGGVTLTASLAFQLTLGNGDPVSDIVSASSVSPNWTYVSVVIPAANRTGQNFNAYLRTQTSLIPPRHLVGYFDNITITPAENIADINYDTAKNFNPADPNVNLHQRNDIGMVFYQTDPQSGDPLEKKYIMSQDDQRAFPTLGPDIRRFTTHVPHFGPVDNFSNLVGWIWDGPTQKSTLANIGRLTIDWVGDPLLGANRSIRVTVTVRDRVKEDRTLSYSRTIYPPTD
ncbi:MAG: prepilin-type N-terminal cleavage/methylation domain-containing protein [Elusimicrobia bacterium]|nr:prepilin-type N-terminal cleavage/methylation domain-containing protein [Elusimicrobiota bacterium]